MGALEKTRAAFFGRVFELSLTKEYVSRWTAIHAIRELIQNALDSESPFEYTFECDPGNTYTLVLRSRFTTLTPATLLLGSTSKTDRPDAIGSFGEGYKIALLVLTREGYSVEMHNNDVVWLPSFQFSRAFGADVLVVNEQPSPNKENQGLTFRVSGLNQNTMDEVRASCLLMQGHHGETKTTQYGDILLERPGELYVGNLFVCMTEMKFGYNILPKYLRLERDRQTVWNWELVDITTKMWTATNEMQRIATMIQEEYPDIKYNSWDVPELIKEECYRIFRKQHPEALIASSASEARRMIEDGLTTTIYVGGGMYNAINDHTPYKTDTMRVRVSLQTPKQVLEQWFKENRSEMRTKAIVSFKELLAKTDKWER